MRNLSIKLFDLLKKAGKPLSEEWKQIDSQWFTWDSEEPISPGMRVIVKSQQPEIMATSTVKLDKGYITENT